MNEEKRKKFMLKALLDVQIMYSRLEIAAALKHPVLGTVYRDTLRDNNPRMYQKAMELNQALEMDDES